MPPRPLKAERSHASNSVPKSTQPECGPHADKARKWMWLLLAVLVASQMYFVQELLAALFLFTLGFVVLGLLALAVYGLRKVGGRGLAWTQRVRVAALAMTEEVSRKLLRRPRSEPAR